MYRTKIGNPSNQVDPNPIKENPLGLLIVLNKTGRRRQSVGQKNSEMIDRNRSDDNETSAFSYSSDTDDDEEESEYYLNEDRRAYLSELNEEFAFAMTLDNKRFRFEPCRRMKPEPEGHKKRKKTDSENERTKRKKKNVYKREESPRRSSNPDDQRKMNFWSPSSSWSAVGRFFEKFKHHRREEDALRKLSLQTNSSSQDTEDGSETPEYRFRNSSYDDPTSFLKQVKERLLSEMKQSGDETRLKVVSKDADDAQFTVTSTGGESLAVCKEYFSRLTCYDAMPQLGEIVAVDTRTPIEEVFNIMRRHRTLGVVMWNSSENNKTRKLCDIESLIHIFWPSDIASASNTVTELRRPVGEFFATVVGDEENKENNYFENGVSAEFSLIEAARLFRNQGRIRIPSSAHIQRHGRLLLPLVNELTGDVIDALSAGDILRFLSKELCKFDSSLLSTFDRISISDLPGSSSDSSRDDEKWQLYTTDTLRRACTVLIESRRTVLPVFDPDSKSIYSTTFSIADLIDLVTKDGFCNETVLSKCLHDLFVDRPKKEIPICTPTTSLSKLLKIYASSNSDHGSWDALSPVAVIVDETGQFVRFLESEHVLTLVLSLDTDAEPKRKISSKTGRERNDSGVGDEELMFLEETQ